MMGRIGVILSSWWNALLGRAEKPGLILDTAYETFTTQLFEVKKSVADVATQKFAIEKQAQNAQSDIDRLTADAEAELADGNEDLAMRILERKAQAQIRMEELVGELKELQAQQTELEAAERKLADQIADFGRQKEVKKAQFRSAAAQVKISESLTGINETGISVGRALGRINEKTDQMEARAKAIPELIKHGTLSDLASGGKAPIDREIEESRIKRDANRELEAMKGRLGITAPAESAPQK
jgi:phage shock protein A